MTVVEESARKAAAEKTDTEEGPPVYRSAWSEAFCEEPERNYESEKKIYHGQKPVVRPVVACPVVTVKPFGLAALPGSGPTALLLTMWCEKSALRLRARLLAKPLAERCALLLWQLRKRRVPRRSLARVSKLLSRLVIALFRRKKRSRKVERKIGRIRRK